VPSNERANRRADHVDRRRAQILDAARRVVLERGMANTRVADIAEAVNVSGGLIHYHFATKDELMAEMLRATSDGEIRHLDAIVSGPGTAIERLDRVLRHYIPRTRSDQSWILWIESWAAGLRAPVLREILAELEAAWIAAIEAVISDGVKSGEFACDDPAGAAERLDALLDGLVIRCTLHPQALPRKRVVDHVRAAAAREVGLDRSAFST
jgi:AcrR family transcriptional regulator